MNGVPSTAVTAGDWVAVSRASLTVTVEVVCAVVGTPPGVLTSLSVTVIVSAKIPSSVYVYAPLETTAKLPWPSAMTPAGCGPGAVAPVNRGGVVADRVGPARVGERRELRPGGDRRTLGRDQRVGHGQERRLDDHGRAGGRGGAVGRVVDRPAVPVVDGRDGDGPGRRPFSSV